MGKVRYVYLQKVSTMPEVSGYRKVSVKDFLWLKREWLVLQGRWNFARITRIHTDLICKNPVTPNNKNGFRQRYVEV